MGAECEEVAEYARLARDGDTESLDELYLRYRKIGYLYLRKYPIIRADKDSIVWEAICRAVQTFDPSLGLFSTYLWRWCVNYAIKYIQDTYVVRRAEVVYVDSHESYDTWDWLHYEPDTAEGLHDKRRAAAVNKLIEELPERQRVLVKWQMRGFGLTEVASMAGVSKQRVYTVNKGFEKKLMEVLDEGPCEF